MSSSAKRPGQPQPSGTNPPSPAPAASAATPRTILLVDDEDDLRATIRRALKPSGYRILEASSAAEAIEWLGCEDIDAVISDFHMPGKSGLDLLQRVRLAHPDVLRIMLTGSRDIDVAVRALNEGAAERYILKPWDNLDLNGMVALALATHRRRPGPRARGQAHQSGGLRVLG
jgi:DNA-binding NtrC family response regulator